MPHNAQWATAVSVLGLPCGGCRDEAATWTRVQKIKKLFGLLNFFQGQGGGDGRGYIIDTCKVHQSNLTLQSNLSQ
jgi:hypothetical protein